MPKHNNLRSKQHIQNQPQHPLLFPLLQFHLHQRLPQLHRRPQPPPNIAYGLFLCRGDVPTTGCQDCVTTPTKVVQRCPKSKNVIIWYDE
ncbi:hypothetical protein ACSBR2_015976 [Camellia fascicularis]